MFIFSPIYLGHGVIIAWKDSMPKYLSMLFRQAPIESRFMARICDNLNAEVALGNRILFVRFITQKLLFNSPKINFVMCCISLCCYILLCRHINEFCYSPNSISFTSSYNSMGVFPRKYYYNFPAAFILAKSHCIGVYCVLLKERLRV